MPSLLDRLYFNLQKIRAERPLVLNLTNYVAMDLSANALLAIGASPLMAHAEEELAELVRASAAIVVNIGTLDRRWTESASLVFARAAIENKPVVLDPVGSGASSFRTATARSFFSERSVCVVRGNASEILSLVSDTYGSRGTDASTTPEMVAPLAAAAARSSSRCLVISGPVDHVFAGDATAAIEHGTPELTKVTATGCAASALVAAFLAVEDSPFMAAVGAMALMGLAGETAASEARGPGTFRAALLDALAGFENRRPLQFRVHSS